MSSICLEPEIAYRIAATTDRRYDDQFVVGSLSSLIYCRPSCSSAAPSRRNTRFFSTAADAQERGLRPCKRCRPESVSEAATPSRRPDVAARALRLIRDGLVDREGVPGLARRLGYSERQLHRILLAELGAGTLAIARAHRAQAARLLIDETDLSLAEVAVAAGFGSIRQFNDTMHETFGMSPSMMRARPERQASVPASPIRVQLRCQEPFDGVAVVRFLKRHEVPGLERVTGNAYVRALQLEHGEGVVTLTPQRASVVCDLELEDLRDLVAAIARSRRLFDLEADAAAIHAQLVGRPIIGELVSAHPGIRIPGTVDGFELAVRTIIREGNDPEIARRRTEALVRRHGRPLRIAPARVTHNFPTAAALATADPGTFELDETRARAIHVLANCVQAGDIRLDAGAGLEESITALLAVPGVGPWIASYIALRVLGDPDAFLNGCGRVERALKKLGIPPDNATIVALSEQWRPWRSYAIAQLWRTLDDEDEIA
jgi:AraC family transcriptional regulator of adaptative response / DNA-3-methyladenine glycosylase II